MECIQCNNEEDLSREVTAVFSDSHRRENKGTLLFFNTPSIRGIFKELTIRPGINLNLIDIEAEAPFSFKSRTVVPHVVEMGFSTKGHVRFRMKGQRNPFDNYAGQSYLSFAQGEFETELSLDGGQHIQLVEVQFDPGVFDEFCREWGCILPGKLQPFAENCRDTVVKCPCILPGSMQYLVQDVLKEALSCTDLPIGLEETVPGLTAGIVSYLRRGMQSSGAVLTSGDIERVREARFILEASLESSPGLKELARMVHLNDYKLKTGFRQAYGCTVHQALTEMRLNKAREILEREVSPVSDIAHSVGYSNLGDFGIAFKKKYGLSPRRYRLVSGIAAHYC